MVVRLKGCYTVKPAEPVPQAHVTLSDCDQDKPITHAPTIYFYRPKDSFSVASAIESLTSSLSQALVHFYPVAGRLFYSGTGGRLELDCNGKGSVIYEAESDLKIDDFGDFRPSPELRALVPSVDYSAPIHEIPLFLVQLTKFSCGGIGLGMAISHIVTDGASALHFIGEWARIARGESLQTVPFLDRSLLKAGDPPAAPRFNHEEFRPPPILIGDADNMVQRKKETTVENLHLNKIQIEKLKNKANEGRDNSTTRPYSRYEALTGHLWRSACKARKLESEQLTKVRVAVDFRNRMKPPMPQAFFGNAVLTVLAEGRTGELLSEPLGYAASKIREAVQMVTDEYVRSTLDFLKGQPDLSLFRSSHTVGCIRGAYFGNPNLELTSWVGLPIYDADFGWGKEIYMGPAALGSDGKCFIVPNHDENGSLDFLIRLQVDRMEDFKKFFYEDI